MKFLQHASHHRQQHFFATLQRMIVEGDEEQMRVEKIYSTNGATPAQ